MATAESFDRIGVFHGFPFADYLSERGALHKHDLDYLRESPKAYLDHLQGSLTYERTRAMELGTVYHSLIMDGRTEYVVRPCTYQNDKGEVKDWAGQANACKAWMAAQSKPILSADEESELLAANQLVSRDERVKKILRNGAAEVSMFARCPDTGLRFAARADWLGKDWLGANCIVDLKTTTDASTEAFSKEINDRGYHRQAALYMRVANWLGLNVTVFYFIALQKASTASGEPPRVNVRSLASNAVLLGGGELDDDIALLLECQEANDWPDYSGKGDLIHSIDCPEWAHARYAAKDLNLTIGGKSIAA